MEDSLSLAKVFALLMPLQHGNYFLSQLQTEREEVAAAREGMSGKEGRQRHFLGSLEDAQPSSQASSSSPRGIFSWRTRKVVAGKCMEGVQAELHSVHMGQDGEKVVK